MNKISTIINNKSLNYGKAELATQSSHRVISTTTSEFTGRTVITTKTSGTVDLRYAPKNPKETNLSTSNNFD